MNASIRLLAGILICGFVLSAPRASGQTPREALEPFASLVGKSWHGAFPGGKLTDVQEFHWMFEGMFLRNPHCVLDESGKIVYQGETVYGWDQRAKVIRWTYFNSTGGTITGTLVRSGDGWLAEGENSAPPPQPGTVRSTLRIAGPDEWTMTSLFPDGEGWKERFTITFHPKK